LSASRQPLSLIRPEWRFFALGTVGSVVLALTAPLLPTLVVRPLFDEVLGKAQFQRLGGLLLLSAAILLASSLALFAQDALYGVGASRFAARVRATLFRNALDADTDADGTSGGIAARTALDIRELELFYQGDLTSIVGQGLSVLAVVASLFWASPTMTLFLMAVVTPLVLVSNLVNRRLERTLAQVQRHVQTASTWFSESLEKRALISVFRASERLERVFGTANTDAERASRLRATLVALSAPLAQLTAGVGAVSLLGFAALEVQAGRLSIGGLTNYISLLALGLGPAQVFARGYARLSAMRAPTAAITTALSSRAAPETGERRDAPSGDLRVTGLGVRYPNETALALEDVTLTVRAGSFAALVGVSGSGKTTLTKALLRLLEPSAGQILMGDVNARAYRRDAWREAFAFVPQTPQLFPASIRDNLTLFGEAAEADLWAALRRVGLEDELRALPQHLETELGQHGAGLSGGQAQRLAIARALLVPSSVLILDEPTSNLDAASETRIRDVLESLRGEKTVIVIAHRLSTIQRADTIIVLENGRVVESGSPETLSSHAGRYAALLGLSALPDGDGA
jgi:ATP-binding cassette, subfamily B, bacterial